MCRLVYVIGMVSGGTSAAAGISALEGLLGVDLPVPHYRQSQVEH